MVEHQHARVGRRHAHDRRLRDPLPVRARRALRVPRHQQRSGGVSFRLPPRHRVSQYDVGRDFRLRAVRDRALGPGERPHAVQSRRRHHLEAVAEPVARRDPQSRLRPGGERRAGGRLLGDRNRVHRQAAVLHGEPGHLRSAHAGERAAHLHAPHRRRAGRCQRGLLRHRRRIQAHRHRGFAGLRRVHGPGARLSRRLRPPVRGGARGAAVASTRASVIWAPGPISRCWIATPR